MIGYLSGEIGDGGKDMVIVNTEGGVGYIVSVSKATKDVLLKSSKGGLFTHTIVRNNGIELFGFKEYDEFTAFLLLITVSGVGPKKAMNILESIPVSIITGAIKNEDINILIEQGISKIQASKIVFELYKKVNIDKDSEKDSDLVYALVALGYDKKEIKDCLSNLKNRDASLENKISEALKIMRGVE